MDGVSLVTFRFVWKDISSSHWRDLSSPCFHCRRSNEMIFVVQRDDSAAIVQHDALLNLASARQSLNDTGPGHQSGARVLRRGIQATQSVFEYEADRKHAKCLVSDLEFNWLNFAWRAATDAFEANFDQDNIHFTEPYCEPSQLRRNEKPDAQSLHQHARRWTTAMLSNFAGCKCLRRSAGGGVVLSDMIT